MVEIAKRRKENIGWYYPDPEPLYTDLKNHIAFYAHLMDGCFFDWKKVNYHQEQKYSDWLGKTGIIKEGLLEKASL